MQNINIRLDNGIINNFIKFLKESNTEALDISSNPITQENLIKLLEDIKETKISDLDISGIFFDNDNVPALSSFVKNTKLAGLNFSLSTEVSEESKKALSDAIKENKSLSGCNILGYKIGMKSQDRQALDAQITEITDENNLTLKDVAEVLKNYYENPNMILLNEIFGHYLKLYKGLNKNYLKEELKNLGVTDTEKVFKTVDKLGEGVTSFCEEG